MKTMTNEATKPIKPGSERDDPEYPYLLFVQDRGWKYADEGQRQAAYLREILVRRNKILTRMSLWPRLARSMQMQPR